MGTEPARRPGRGVLRGRGGRGRPPGVVVSSRAPPCPHHQRRGHRRGAGGGGRVPRLVGGRYPEAPRSPRGGGRVRRLFVVVLALTALVGCKQGTSRVALTRGVVYQTTPTWAPAAT